MTDAYRPKHRRPIEFDPFIPRGFAPSQADCMAVHTYECDWRCPRHSPTAYAESMARHCLDSIR